MTNTSYKIKCCMVCAAVCLALLCGCVGHTDTATVWEKTLANSGAVVRVSNCNATETQSQFWPTPEGDPLELMTVEADNIPVMSVQGATPEQVELNFAAPHETGTTVYTLVKPVLNVDYRQTIAEDGTVQYKMETVYTYDVVVTTEQGTDEFLLKCTRQV